MEWVVALGIVFGTGETVGESELSWTHPDVVRWQLTHTAAPTADYSLPDRRVDFRATHTWSCEVSEPLRETWVGRHSRYQRESRSLTCTSGRSWARGVSHCLFETCADGTTRARAVSGSSFTLGATTDDGIYLGLACAIRSPAFGGVYLTVASPEGCD
ncbi:MAG: hypothetical protein AAFP04_01355 [Myxococcota bacterium]